MLKTIIVLPDGRSLSSGTGTEDAIKSVTVIQSVSDDQELSIGAACTNVVQLDIITPDGSLAVSGGEEITVYREDEAGQRHKVGIFLTEKPTRPSANTMRITAFDRMVLLDRDMHQWLADLAQWPYTVNDFAKMVCEACGLTLKNETLLNGEYWIQPFTADSVTGRTLVKWIGQIAGCFARITPDGELEFAWYTPKVGVSIGPREQTVSTAVTYEDGSLTVTGEDLEVKEGDGVLEIASPFLLVSEDGAGGLILEVAEGAGQYFFYQNSLSYEDYTVAAVEKVQLQQTAEDVGCVYPADLYEDANTYRITGNYLLSATDAAGLAPVAQALYERLHTLSYTPCKVTISANPWICAGDVVSVTDKNGKKHTMYVMKKTQKGQRDTLECTGSRSRDSSMVVNTQTLASLTGKVLKLRMDIEGLKAENGDSGGQVASLKLSVNGLETQVSRQQDQLDATNTQLTQLRQDAQSVAVEIKDIRENGVSRVETVTGYTFGADGMRIQKSGQQMENLLDHTGMYVSRSGQILLQASNEGVTAADVTVRNYLIVGEHARLEDYSNGTDFARTACFFI